MGKQIEEGDIVLCTVERIVGTMVFVKIHGDGEGSIIFSEISPGRIRNIRNYVVPKKKIVCKVLKVGTNQIHLSLRRVTQEERKEVMNQYKQEKSFISILKTALGKKAEEIIREIEKRETLYEFLQKIKEDSKELEKLIGKKDSEKIMNILEKQKTKKQKLKKEIKLTTTSEQGIKKIKEILGNHKGVNVKYISAGKYILESEGEDIKKLDNFLKETIQEIEKKAKSSEFEFEVAKSKEK